MALRVTVRTTFTKSRQSYGSPRVTRQLRRAGERVSAKRVARLMREEGLAARRRRRFVCTTDSVHADPVAPNLLAREFAVGRTRACNTIWASDMTDIPTRAGWLYLAVVLELASRRVIGWATSASLDTALPQTALQRALAAREPPQGLVHHSDRGSQGGFSPSSQHLGSMSAQGDCYDNAVAERCFSTLEFELLMRNDWHTREAARRAIFRDIETWYNQKRRHSTLGYLNPAASEMQVLAAAVGLSLTRPLNRGKLIALSSSMP